MDQPKKTRPIVVWTQYALSILISIGVCWYLLGSIKWDSLFSSLEDANIALAIIGLVLPNLVWWWADTRLNQKVIGWFHARIDFWGIFWIRGFTYLMAIIYPPLAEVGILAYLYRKTGMTIKLFSGIVFFKGINTGLGVLFIVTGATLAAYGMGIRLGEHINVYFWWAGLACGFFGFFHAWSYWIRGHSWGPLDRFLDRESEFFIPYAKGNMRHWLITWAYTIFPIMGMFGGYYVTALAFNVHVNPFLFIALSPLVFALAGLPVFFGGYGGTTVFWMQFFPGSGTDADIIALTLFIPTARMLLRVAMGLVSLIPAQEDLALIWRRKSLPLVLADESEEGEPPV